MPIVRLEFPTVEYSWDFRNEHPLASFGIATVIFGGSSGIQDHARLALTIRQTIRQIAIGEK